MLERVVGTDPSEADTDGDGLRDGDEVYGTGPLAGHGLTNPLVPDSDGDGIGDGLVVVLAGVTLIVRGRRRSRGGRCP